jgi:type II secretory pathway component PulK
MPQKNPNRGIALISVLWALLLAASLAAGALFMARTNAVLARRGVDLARGRAAADAAIVDTAVRFMDEHIEIHPRVNSSGQQRDYGGMSVNSA